MLSKKENARLLLGEILENLRFMEMIGKSTRFFNQRKNNPEQAGSHFDFLWSARERKWLRKMRNRFGHDVEAVHDDGSVEVRDKSRKRDITYSLRDLQQIVEKIRLLKIDERLEVVSKFEVECSICGETVDAANVLPCGHGIYSSTDMPKSALVRKPANGILRGAITFRRRESR